MRISGKTLVAGVAGSPVTHSLSPLIHNAWLQAAGIDGVYVAFPVQDKGFEAFVHGLRGGVIRGLNVTVPFKERALALADAASPRATEAGAANVLVFGEDGAIAADNTDGVGLLGAFKIQAPGFNVADGPIVILGAGGAARGAATALLAAGAPEVRVVNRTRSKAEDIAALSGRIYAYDLADAGAALAGANAVINATSAAFTAGAGLDLPLDGMLRLGVAMDMTYVPLETPFLARARNLGHATVDGLEMLIGQAEPAFEAFYGHPPPASVDVRALVLAELERRR